MSDSGFLTSSDLRLGFIKPIGQAWRPVVYSAVDGVGVLEGCILLGNVADLEATATLIRANPQALQDPDFQPLGVGIKGEQFRWPNKTVPFTIDSSLPSPQRVHDAISHWRTKTSLTFRQRQSGDKNFINFKPVPKGCASHVGMRGGQQDIVLSPLCPTGSVIHEIGHAVGLWHEQSRADRDTKIKVIFSNIEPIHRHNFEQHIVDGVDLGEYDFRSIMHYPADAFSSTDQPTIVPLQPLPAGVVLGQRDGLSVGDIAAVERLYA